MKISLLALVSVCLSANLMAAQNLVPNGNFEKPLKESGWVCKMFKNANGSIERTQIQPSEGKFAVRMAIREIRTGFMELWSPEFNLPACKKLTLSCKYKSSAKYQSGLVIIAKYTDNGKQKVLTMSENRLRFEKKSEWTENKKTFDLPKVLEGKKVRVFLKITQYGSTSEIDTVLDEVSLTAE